MKYNRRMPESFNFVITDYTKRQQYTKRDIFLCIINIGAHFKLPLFL